MGMYDYDEGSYFYDDYGNVDHKYADEVDEDGVVDTVVVVVPAVVAPVVTV